MLEKHLTLMAPPQAEPQKLLFSSSQACQSSPQGPVLSLTFCRNQLMKRRRRPSVKKKT